MGDIRQRLSKRYPEIDLFDSHEAASDAVNVWNSQLYRNPLLWLAWLVGGCCVGICVVGALALVRRWIEVPPSVYGILAGGFTVGFGFPAVSWISRRRFHRFLRERLLASGVPVCFKCGYDLRGQTVPRCPECGTPFDPSLIQE